MKISKQTIIELLVIIFLGFTPLLWFHGNQVILGHDAGLPLNPVSHFLDRLNIWTNRYGLGFDQSLFLPGLFIHGFEAIVFFFVHSLQLEQKITFIFWLMLPGLTMYYFAKKISNEFNLRFFVLPVSIFYMFNHFLLQGWFIAERTKFSLYAALPLMIALLFDWQEKRKSTLKTAILISFIFLFLNGEGSLPLFGGIIISFLAFVFFYLFQRFSLKKIKNLLSLIFLTGIISVFLNAYWLLPYGFYVLHSYQQQVTQAGGLNGILGWLQYVSEDSSLINLFRLQGIPEWYQNPLHSYANTFLQNRFLIVVSFLIPVFAFFPLLVAKGKVRKILIFFAFLAVFSIIFIAGSHPPFGTFYVLLINFLPGFIAFRTPFYKFAPALWFSYSLLLGFSINYLILKIPGQKILKYLALLVVCMGMLFYSYPFFTGQFFDYIVGQRTNRISVPSYVFEFGKWSDSATRSNVTTLALPMPNTSNNVDAYNWGYWSPSPITTLLTTSQIINATGTMPPQQQLLVNNLLVMMKNNTSGWEQYAQALGIESFLLRKDFAWNLKDTPADNPLDYLPALQSKDLMLTKKFGEWEVYDFKSNFKTGKFQASDSVTYMQAGVTDLSAIVSSPNFNPNIPFYLSGDPALPNRNILSLANIIYVKPQCIECNLQSPIINLDAYTPLLTRSSVFYSLIKHLQKTKNQDITSSAYDSLRKILEFQKEVAVKDGNTIYLLSLQDYISSLGRLNSFVEHYTQDAGKIDNSVLIDIDNILLNEKTILIKNIYAINDPYLLSIYKQSYQMLINIKSRVDSFTWMTTDENKKKFLVNAPQSGTYSFLYRTQDPNLQVQKLLFTLDNVEYQVSLNPTKNSWLDAGTITLSQGLHRLTIGQQTTNLYTGPQDFAIQGNNEGSCYFSNRITGNENQVVRFSFLHKQLSGTKEFTVIIWGDNSQLNSLNRIGDVLEPEYSPQYYQIDYAFKNDNDSVFLGICNAPEVNNNNVQSAIDIQGLSIRKLYYPDVLLYKIQNETLVQNVPYNEQSPTHYLINREKLSKNNKIITFKESYSPLWELDNQKSLFMANGFANAWIINNNQKINQITYKPQILGLIGFVISALAVIMGGIIFLAIKFYEKK